MGPRSRRRSPYRERAHLQLVHWVAVRRAGGGRTAPVLVCGERVLADSADIVDEADARAPERRRLYPDDETDAAEVRALERDFDERLGPHGRRWMYHALRGRRDIAIAYACTGVPAWERRALPIVYPLVIEGDRPLSGHHAGRRRSVRGRGAGHLRRGRQAARRRPAVPLRRSVHRRRPHLRRAGGVGPDAAGVRRAAAPAGRAAGADGGGGPRASRAPRRRLTHWRCSASERR